MIQIIKNFDDEACVDETTWAFMLFGGLTTGCVYKKLGMSKGDKTLML